MIRTVIFDIGRVLLDFNWREYLSSYHFDLETEERIAHAVFENPSWIEFDRGILSTEQVIDLFVKTDPELEEQIHLVCKSLYKTVTKLDYPIPWIRHLKEQGLRVLYLSNYSDYYFRTTQFALNFLSEMDGGIFSYRVHMVKPDHEIYHKIISEYHLNPEETVFLDDMPANIKAAKECGLHGIDFRSLEQAKKELELLGVH